MGWKGAVRSLAAAARAAERENIRLQKLQHKAQVAENAENAVYEWQDLIIELTSVHHNKIPCINWANLASKEPPRKPSPNNDFLIKAQRSLDAFEPKFFDFLNGGTAKRHQKLKNNINIASQKDLTTYDNKVKEYDNKYIKWQQSGGLAKRVIKGEIKAYSEAISAYQSLETIDLLGENIAFSIDENIVHAKPKVHTQAIVPDFRRKQLKSGKLSETKMPKGDFYDLYQDYVASVSLKVASDVLQILPIDEVFVTCTSDLLNSKTGHIENTPILSIQFVRETFEKLNLSALDPSDALHNFNHAINFKRTKGFNEIEPLR